MTKTQLEQFRRLARQTAGMPEMLPAGELCLMETQQMVNNLVHLANKGVTEDIRLKATLAVIEIGSREAQHFCNSSRVAIEELLNLPPEQQPAAAARLYANQLITKEDLATVMQAIDRTNLERIAALRKENEEYLQELEGRRPKTIDAEPIRNS